MSIRWSENMVLKFLELYQKHDCLWNFRLNKYKNKDAKEQALNSIIKEMGIPGLQIHDVKNKIKTIRTMYKREHSLICKSKMCGTEEVYKPTLFWYNRADVFLSSVTNKRDVTSKELNETDDEEVVQPPPKSKRKIEQIEQKIERKSEQKSERKNENRKTSIQKRDNNLDNATFTVTHQNTTQNTKIMGDDEDAQIFGNFIASTLKNFRSDMYRRRLKRKIQAAVLEMQEMDDLPTSNNESFLSPQEEDIEMNYDDDPLRTEHLYLNQEDGITREEAIDNIKKLMTYFDLPDDLFH